MQNVEQTLKKTGSIWIVNTSSWTGTNRLTPEDIGKDSADIPDIVKLGSKYIIPKDVRLKLQGGNQGVRGIMKILDIDQFLPGIKSAWFVPDSKLLALKESLEAYREKRRNVAREIAEDIPDIRRQMIEKYPMLAEVEWPGEQAILEQVDVKWTVLEVSGVTTNETDSDALIAAKQEFRENLTEKYNEYIKEILKEAHTAIIESCEEISKRILDTGDAVTAATLKKPQKVIDKYMLVAENFDLDDIKAKINELKGVVDAADSKEIKDRWDIAREFGTTLRKIGDEVGDLSGITSDGRAKRRIVL